MTTPTAAAEVRHFIDDFLRTMAEGNVAIFAGAGLSVPAGVVDWRGIMRDIASELGLLVEEEHDLIAVAQYHYNTHGNNRSELNRAILQRVGTGDQPTDNHRILAELPISVYWTTNYDCLMEMALASAGRIVDVKHDVKQLASTRPRRDAVVYKMHGDVGHPADAVLTKDDYEHFAERRGAFTTALAGDLVEKTFLFLGFSFSDPNLDYILARVRSTFRDNQRQHYCVMKVRERLNGESEDVFQRACVRQALAISDLKRFNIKTIVVNEYQRITEILNQIDRRYRRRTVFISGSAAAYAPWTKEQVEAFLRQLGAALVQQGFRIVTGMGLGVGDALIAGAVEQVYKDRTVHLEDAIVMRPFPQAIPAAADRQQVWERYRQDLISKAGIGLLFFGNKQVDGVVVPADGVRREFDIARQHDLAVIPVGASGYMAETLWTEVSAAFTTLYPNADAELTTAFRKLGDPVEDPAELIQPILDVITLIAEE